MLENYASHTSSAIGLARLLRVHGHDVVFVGKEHDAQNMVEEAGFCYRQFSGDRYIQKLQRRRHAAAALSDLAADVLRILEGDFDLLICDRFNPIAALLAHKLGKKYIFLQTSLPSADPQSSRYLSGASAEAKTLLRRYLKSYRILIALMKAQMAIGNLLGYSGADSLCRAAGMSTLRFCADPYDYLKVPTIVCCPRPFDLPQSHPPHIFFSNTTRPARKEEPFDGSRISPHDRLLYVSFGSFVAADSFPALYKWLQKAIVEFGGWEGWHIIVSMGRANVPGSIGATPKNVTVLGISPQLTVLSRATAMVTHAGINSVVECICAGVPMIAAPMFGDQFGNAGRIVHHGLGLPFDYRRESIRQLKEKIIEVADNPLYRLNLQRMRDECLEPHAAEDPVVLIERIMRPQAGQEKDGPGQKLQRAA